MNNRIIGDSGEAIACDFLKKNGYKILAQNYQIRGGEIDIVATEGDTLVFIEVKTRYSHKFGLPVESITTWKIHYLLKTAQFYIQKINWGNKPFRLDFIGVDFAQSKTHPKIELIKNITS